MKRIIAVIFALAGIIFAAEQAQISEKTFILTYMNTADPLGEIKALLTPAGRIKIDTANNSIIISDTKEALDYVSAKIKEIDNPERTARRIVTSFRILADRSSEGLKAYPAFSGSKDYFGYTYTITPDVDSVARSLKQGRSDIETVYSSDTEVEEGTQFSYKNSTAEVKAVPITTGLPYNNNIQLQFTLKWNNYEFKNAFSLRNGAVWEGGVFTDAKKIAPLRYILLVSAHIIDSAPPRCENSTGISNLGLAAYNRYNPQEIHISWYSDRPFGANGIARYNIYRDDKPIIIKDASKLIISDLAPDNSTFSDSSPKTAGKEYFYAVTAVNASGDEQAISRPASIKIKTTAEAQ